jgi:hypothetical protein
VVPAFAAGGSKPDPTPASDFNRRVVNAVAGMPRGGGYSTGSQAFRNLQASIVIGPRGLEVSPERAQPSFCSGASWLVFLEAVEGMVAGGLLSLSPGAQRALLVQGQEDGEGLWGRWNANGPGTPRLVYELGMGRNFVEDAQAKPGDFLKIFWTDAVGKYERGHSVVFLGFEREDGVDYVKYFSSNEDVGFTATRTPRSRIQHGIWSRVTEPAALENFSKIPAKDPYLGGLLERESSIEEAWEKSGIRR